MRSLATRIAGLRRKGTWLRIVSVALTVALLAGAVLVDPGTLVTAQEGGGAEQAAGDTGDDEDSSQRDVPPGCYREPSVGNIIVCPSVSIAASPNPIRVGQSTTLSWESSWTTSRSINQGIGSVNANDSRSESPTSTTTYTITGQSPAGSHRDDVTVTVEQLPDPPAPAGLSASPGSETSVNLSWNSRAGITKYWVRDHSDSISGTSYTVTGLSKCTTRIFKVRGYGDGTTYKAKWSPEGLVQGSTVCPDPPAPAGFSASAGGSSTINLRWNSRSGINKYEVEGQSSSTSYTVSGLQPCTTYTYRLRGHGDGATYAQTWGPWVSASATTEGCIRPPPAPAGFSASAGGSSTINLRWNSRSGINKYEVEGQSSSISSTSYTVSGLQANTKYTFKVRAYGDGTSYTATWGDWATATATTGVPPTPTPTPPPTGPPDAPTPVSLANEPAGSTSLKVSWTVDSTTGLTRFQVMRKRTANDWPPDIQAATVDVVAGQTEYEYGYDGLERLITYRVRVRACTGATDATDCSGWTESGDVTMPDVPPVSAPGAVTVVSFDSRTGTSFRVKWEAPTEVGTGITGYGLQRKLGDADWPPTDQVVVVGREPREWTFRNLEAGTHWVRLQACAGKNTCAPWPNTGHSVTIPPPTTPPVVTAPDKVATPTFSNITSTAFTVDWEAPSNTGGAAITKYEVNWAAGQTASVTGSPLLTEAAIGDDADEDVTPSTTYTVTVRACNHPAGTTPTRCGAWSDGADVSTPPPEPPPSPELMRPTTTPTPGRSPMTVQPPEAADCPARSRIPTSSFEAPRDLIVTPLPQRKAALCWSPVTGANKYVIRIDRFGGGTPVDFEVNPPTAGSTKATGQVLDLDALVTSPTSGELEGLGHQAAYQIHVWARMGAPASFTYSIPSESIIIIDTPITVANGHSPGAGPNDGKVKLTWTRVHEADVLGDSAFPDGDYYYFRYRRASPDHDEVGWQPGTYVTDQSRKASMLDDDDTITGLKLGEIYAIQLRYVKSGQPQVFAARDAYVWVSDELADGEDRVAGFPLTQRLTNKTYSYRICEETFFPHDAMNPANSRRNHWERLIEHASLQWQRATQGLITVIREVDVVESRPGSPTIVNKPCAGYAGILDEIETTINMSGVEFPNIRKAIVSLIVNSKREGIVDKLDLLESDDDKYREILMYNDVAGPLEVATKVGAFSQIADRIRYEQNCWCEIVSEAFAPANMCYYGDDIIIRRSAYDKNTLGSVLGFRLYRSADDDPLQVPEAGVRFNLCNNASDRYENSAYSDFLHEVGHALGIGGGDPKDADGNYWLSLGHPERIRDTIMNYIFEPGCWPYPLDLLVIDAMYRT